MSADKSLSNITISSWDRKERMLTDEDAVCSYSKISNVSPIKEFRRHSKMHVDESIDLHAEKRLEQEADKIRLEQLGDLILQKDEIIQRQSEYQQWLQEQNEAMMANQQMMMYQQLYNSEQQQLNRERDLHKMQTQLQQLQTTLLQTEQQLHKSLQQQGILERENSIMKTKLMDLENKLFQQESQYISIQEDIKLSFNETIQEYKTKQNQYQRCLEQQDQHICRLEKEVSILSMQLALSRKSSKDSVGQDKSPKRHEDSQQSRFVECIVDMVMSCSSRKDAERPNLKQCWKWLKQILEEYMSLKKHNMHSTKSSQYVPHKRENSFLNTDVNRRFQTSVDDYENKSFRSNTLLTKISK